MCRGWVGRGHLLFIRHFWHFWYIKELFNDIRLNLNARRKKYNFAITAFIFQITVIQLNIHESETVFTFVYILMELLYYFKLYTWAGLFKARLTQPRVSVNFVFSFVFFQWGVLFILFVLQYCIWIISNYTKHKQWKSCYARKINTLVHF